MFLLILICGFLAVLFLFLGFTRPLVTGYREMVEEEEHALATTAFSRSFMGRMARLFGRTWGRLLPDLSARLDERLEKAGRPLGAISGASYLGLVAFVGLSVFLVLFALTILTIGVSILGFMIALGMALFMAFSVYRFVNAWVADRQKEIARQFPYFLDLCVMALGSGATEIRTLSIYQEFNGEKAFASEVRIMLNQMSMGRSFVESLRELSERVPSEEVASVIKSILYSHEMGTELAEALRNHAEEIRFLRQQQAERAAASLKVKMQGPAMMMTISVIGLILMTAMLSIAGGGVL